MAPSSDQFIDSNQTIINNVLMVSSQACYFACQQDISNNTVIIIGGNGEINIKQECNLTGLSCIMKSTLDNQIQNSMASMLDQSTTQQAGWVLNFADLNETVNITQYMQNSITQMMSSTCTFETTQSITGNYFYVEGRNGDFNMSQTAEIANSTCNMDNSAKSTTYNEQTSDASQSTRITNPLAMIVAAIVIGLLFIGLIFVLSLVLRKGGSGSSETTTTVSTAGVSV